MNNLTQKELETNLKKCVICKNLSFIYKEVKRMKKIISLILVLMLALEFSGCASRKNITTTTDNNTVTRTYEPYGLLSLNNKNPNIRYKISVGNVVLSVILCETIVVPVILIGWYAYEPVGPIINSNMRGVVNN